MWNFYKHLFYRTPLDDYFFLKAKLSLKSAQIQILFAACQRFTMVRIFDSRPGWKFGLTPFLGQPFCKNNSSSLGRRCLEENVWLRMRKEKKVYVHSCTIFNCKYYYKTFLNINKYFSYPSKLLEWFYHLKLALQYFLSVMKQANIQILFNNLRFVSSKNSTIIFLEKETALVNYLQLPADLPL